MRSMLKLLDALNNDNSFQAAFWLGCCNKLIAPHHVDYISEYIQNMTQTEWQNRKHEITLLVDNWRQACYMGMSQKRAV